MCIDNDAAELHNNEALEVIDTSDPAVCRHMSLLLQIIAIEYKGVFVRHIESSVGEGHSIHQGEIRSGVLPRH